MSNSLIHTTHLPTTTYPFSFTANGFTGTVDYPFDLPFTTPTASPSVIPFEISDNCCNRWGQFPRPPIGLNASCSISLSKCDNPHAFWDLYACCKGAEPQQFGNMCSGTCDAVDQTWQELMSCLQGRAAVVSCKPDSEEIRIPSSSSSPMSTGTQGLGNSLATSVPVESSMGAGSSINVSHVRGSKTSVAIMFAIFALSVRILE
jgi:hypothetical protein